MRYLLIAAGSACTQPWDRDALSSLLSANGLSPDDGETIFIYPAPAPSDQATLAKLAENAPTSQVAFSRIPYFRAEPLCDALLPLVRKADLVLFAAGPEGDELACRLAVRCGGSSATAVQHFALNGPEKELLIRRSTYAGHMTGTWQLTRRPFCISLARTLQADSSLKSSNGFPQIIGLPTNAEPAQAGGLSASAEPAQAKDFPASSESMRTDDPAPSSEPVPMPEPAQAQGSYPAHSQPAAPTQPPEQTRPQFREFVIDFNDPLHPEDRTTHADPKAGGSLEYADFLLAVGRGIRSARGAASASEHAQRLGAVLGATRPVVMSAWLPMEKLVGVSGSLTSPQVAIVCGAGGSPAFYSGIEQARTIIAINTDPDAPIMKKSDLAIVGDWDEVLTELTLEL